MIKFLQDFTEEEKTYWKNIEEILHYRQAIKHYDKLLLIRLTLFIEGQIFSREYQCFKLIKKISNKKIIDSKDSVEKEIKKRLGNLSLKGISYPEYLENIMEANNILVTDIINFLLDMTFQYNDSHSALKTTLDLIYDELNIDNSNAGNIPIINNPEEVSVNVNKKQNILKQDLTIPQIALLHVYNRTPISKPSSINLEAQKLAESYSFTSGEYLYNTYLKLQGHQAQRLKSKKNPEKMKIDIKAVLPYLDVNNAKKANEDLIFLNNLINNNKEEE